MKRRASRADLELRALKRLNQLRTRRPDKYEALLVLLAELVDTVEARP